MTMMTIERVKAEAKAAGSHFFDPAAMRFFRSRVCRTVYAVPDGHVFFVTSEKGPSERRLYTVRGLFRGKIYTVGEFQEHSTRARALGAAFRTAATAAGWGGR